MIKLIWYLLPLLMMSEMDSVHKFRLKALNSNTYIDFADFAGKKILIVNVASKCGFTYQYEGLNGTYVNSNANSNSTDTILVCTVGKRLRKID